MCGNREERGRVSCQWTVDSRQSTFDSRDKGEGIAFPVK